MLHVWIPQRLKRYGVDPENILLVCITASPTAIDRLSKETPDVTVVTASIEAEMDDNKLLNPGLGGFGSRY